MSTSRKRRKSKPMKRVPVPFLQPYGSPARALGLQTPKPPRSRAALGRLSRRPLSLSPLGLAFIPRVDQRHDIFHAPKFVSHASSHRGRHFQRLMDAAEIVKHEVERQRVAVVFQLL